MDINVTHNVHGTFVSEKINKIRWRPDPFNNAHYFLTGSWDNDQSSIKLWDFQESEEDADIYPYLVNESAYKGDVTELKMLNCDYFVASSSVGSVHLMCIDDNDATICCKIEWKHLHAFPNKEASSCTTLATYNKDIVTVGEDGCINLLNSDSEDVIRTIDNADSCSLHCVTFLKHAEILTSNLRGQMKIWDIRVAQDEPMSTFMLSGEQVTPTCLEFHPTQRHIVVAGDEEGSLTVWDLRHNNYPINLLSAHEGSVSEIQFHPDHPDQLFSCSNTGDIWHWSTKGCGSSIGLGDSIWLANETINNKFEVFTLMPQLHKPINSLDLNRNKAICGCDNEAIYLINGIQFFD